MPNLLLLLFTMTAATDVQHSAVEDFRVELVATGLQHPWDMVFLDPRQALVSDRRAGMIYRLTLDSGTVTPLSGVPQNVHVEDAGMQGLALHPQFARNGWVYMAYSAGEPERSTTAVDRARLTGDGFVDVERIFTADAWSEDRFHYGARILFHDGHLFLTIGDRHHEARAQDLRNHTGTILRLNDDGSVPDDNPFVGQDRARPEIWSYGHRNPQGMAVDSVSGTLWINEHGPRGGDELNRVQPGANYGWPVVSWGFEYDGGPIGKGIVAQEGTVQPVWVWSPSIAPSGLLVYTGDRFPDWNGSLFTGSMARLHLNRLVLADGQVVLEERLLPVTAGRVRFVVQGPDGLIYFGNDNGEIRRLVPAS